eukprot:scpid92993/ scgid35525/ Follistatin-related protein 5; Follistatin-like protein 5
MSIVYRTGMAGNSKWRQMLDHQRSRDPVPVTSRVSLSCAQCQRHLNQQPGSEEGCRQRGWLKPFFYGAAAGLGTEAGSTAAAGSGNCSCGCTVCAASAPRCDPTSTCVLGAPFRSPMDKWTCCRPCLEESSARCLFAKCDPIQDCAELERVRGHCCPRCKRPVSSCPGVKCPRQRFCVKYHQVAPGQCCAKCRKFNRSKKVAGVCTGVRCGKGQLCVPKLDGSGPTCRCRLKCKTAESKVCGTDGREYRNSCEMHRQACLHARKLRVYTAGPCKNTT